MRTDKESRRTSVASFIVQTLTHLVNITSLLVETLPRFERQRQFVSAIVSQGDLHVTRWTNVDSNFQILVARIRQVVTPAHLYIYIYYGLYFDDVDGVDVFSTGHSQYFGSSFFFGGGLGGPGEDTGRYPFRSTDFRCRFHVFVNCIQVSMYTRSRSSSRSKFHSHVRFESLDVYDSIIFKYSCSNQAFRLAVRDPPVLPSQSMVISNQPGSARPVGSCQKFPWHGTRKNVMRENGPLFQHRYFLHDKILINDESL
ncbi:hypothetical protein ALC57_07637 [Trachymyrmex cornetzi]|uniref:Uncharacterized protein n=1 Tax=Trachymyrmex cornetzi TaxID=471704 RepID=A0A151J7M6_9HYME|nr:hypothetical protein ALC57_07637 [Trachymyrmex cornetzi]